MVRLTKHPRVTSKMLTSFPSAAQVLPQRRQPSMDIPLGGESKPPGKCCNRFSIEIGEVRHQGVMVTGYHKPRSVSTIPRPGDEWPGPFRELREARVVAERGDVARNDHRIRILVADFLA